MENQLGNILGAIIRAGGSTFFIFFAWLGISRMFEYFEEEQKKGKIKEWIPVPLIVIAIVFGSIFFFQNSNYQSDPNCEPEYSIVGDGC